MFSVLVWLRQSQAKARCDEYDGGAGPVEVAGAEPPEDEAGGERSHSSAERADGTEDAEGAALLLVGGVEGNEGRECRAAEAGAEGHEAEPGIEQALRSGVCEKGESDGYEKEAGGGGSFFPELGGEAAHDAALHEDEDEADEDHHLGDVQRGVAEAFDAEEGKGELHAAEGEDVDEVGEVGLADGGGLRGEQALDGIALEEFLSSFFGGEGLGEAGPDPEEVGEGKEDRDEGNEGEGIDAVGGQLGPVLEGVEQGAGASDSGTGHEAEAEGGPDHAHPFGAVFAGGDVGYGGGGDGEVAAHGSPDEAGGDEQGEVARDHPENVAEAGAEGGVEEDGAAAVLVGETAPEGGEEELESGVEGAEHAPEEDWSEAFAAVCELGNLVELLKEPCEHAVLPVELEVVVEHGRKEREDHAEADEIDEDRQEDNTKR